MDISSISIASSLQLYISMRKSFDGTIYWVYWCSCNNTRAALVDSLSSHITTSFNQFTENCPECIHIQATHNILSTIDGLHMVTPQQDLAG